MATFNQFKINQMAKDMGLKSKDLTDLMAEKGMTDTKAQKVLTPQEFNVLMQTLTEANQVDNIDDYMDGKTCIPSKIAAAKAAAAKEAAHSIKASPAARSLPMVLYRLSMYTWVISKLPACRPLRKPFSISGLEIPYSLESTRRARWLIS